MNFRRIFYELTAYTSACANAPYYVCLCSLLDLLMLPIRHAHGPYCIFSYLVSGGWQESYHPYLFVFLLITLW